MPNYKSLKTYSKTQKVANYSTLFDNKETFNFDSDTSKIEYKDTVPTITKSEVPEPDSSEIRKRKARVDHNPKKEKKVSKKKEVKLFQMSNMDSSNCSSTSSKSDNNTCGDIVEKMKDDLVISSAKKTMTSSKSATNIKPRATTRGRPKKTDKENKTEDKIGRIKKSKSTSNMILSAKKIELINSENNSKAEVIEIKSIMKSDDKEIKDTKEVPVVKAKKAVKILEEINYKTDQITNFKIDNRTKHAASTSTPSGLRRRPLKMPAEVSMIGTPDKKN